MSNACGRPSLGKRRSEEKDWGVGPQKRVKARRSSESEPPDLWPDTGAHLIGAESIGNGNRTVSPPSFGSFGTLSPESNRASSNTPLTTPSQSSPTHDTTRAQYHIKDVASFATALEQAASSAFPNQGHSRYVTVHVCLIRWEEDESEEFLRVKPEVERLRDVFRDVYGLDTEIWHIPTIRSHHKLMGKALDFIEDFDQNNNLFVVYYAGHGTMNEHRQSVWTCRRDIQYATVDWSSIQSLFSKASSDVLVVLDCCAAASAAATSGNGVLETIAACGFEGIAPPPGRFSFTNTLIDVLCDWNAKPSFSAAALHGEILFQLKSKSLERGRSGGPRMEWCRTPVHFIYSSDSRAQSIELCRRKPRVIMDQNRVDTVSQPYSPRLTSYHDSAVLDLASKENLENALTSLTPTRDLTIPHVLISLALEESQERLDLESWRRWLTRIPALTKYTRIQGAYKSYSTLLILALPVMIWDMLPENPACCFIGYITSENMWTSGPTIGAIDIPAPSLAPPPRGDDSLLRFLLDQAGNEGSIPMGLDSRNSLEMLPSQEQGEVAATHNKQSKDPQSLSEPPPVQEPQNLYCSTCKRLVKTHSELKKHDLRHQKPYRCQIKGCPRIEGFSTANDLERHIKSKHPSVSPELNRVKAYRCLVPGCKSKDKTWSRPDNLRSHLKRIHSDQVRTEEEDLDHVIAKAGFSENSNNIDRGLASSLSNDANTHPQGQSMDMENSIKEMPLFQDRAFSSGKSLNNNSGDTCPPTRGKYLSGHSGTSDGTDNQLSNSDLEEPFSSVLTATNNSTLTSEKKASPHSDSEAQIKALEALKAIRELDYVLDPPQASSSMAKSTYDENQVECQVCKRFKGRPCELKKHMKRHERPYGCTFLSCNKTFGTKNDWKRHENSQHLFMETWKCNEPSQGGGACAKVCYRRQTYQEHLSKEHKITDKDLVKEKIESARIGKNCQERFWCGFCVKVIEHKKRGVDAWTERFDHIDGHFMGHHGLEKQSIREWVAMDTESSKKDDCEDLSDACSLLSMEE